MACQALNHLAHYDGQVFRRAQACMAGQVGVVCDGHYMELVKTKSDINNGVID